MSIQQTLVTTSPTTVYTSSGETAITIIYLLNDHNSEVTTDIFVVPFEGSATVATQIYRDVAVDVDATKVINTEKLILSDGDSIVMQASDADSLYCTISYVSL